uniref:Uncharacterized protein n=1 Tax=Anguilla anguilla TaxID=7936 RepID=A0A0E9PCD5_ANGAN
MNIKPPKMNVIMSSSQNYNMQILNRMVLVSNTGCNEQLTN